MGHAGQVGLFDIGATHSRVAIARNAAGLDDHLIFATDHSVHGPTKVADALKRLAGGRPFDGIVGGIPSQIDRHGLMVSGSNLPKWEGMAIGREFEHILQTTVIIENDTAICGLGEVHFGAGRGYQIVMYETVSTGVNAVRIVDGRIDRNAHGFEVGRQLILGQNGRMTTLAAATSGAALERKYGRPPRDLALTGLWRSEAKLLALGLHNSLLALVARTGYFWRFDDA